MDRQIVYDGQIPQTLDILDTAKFSMIDGAYQDRAFLGTTTVIAGLACTPMSPPSLQVSVGVGSMFALMQTDATAYGKLPADTTHTIVKQGINYDPDVFTITPPNTVGFSQNFLVQATIADQDSDLAVLPYYNVNTPLQPLSGPNNSGATQYTTRRCNCTPALKAGIAATSGTQTTPTPDPGYVGLFVVTVAYGQTAITQANIVQLATAPFFPTLPAVPPDVQQNLWTFAQDVGSVNAYAATIAPPVAALTPGMGVFIRIANTNTAAATFNLNGLGAVAIHRGNGSALSAGDLNAGQIVALAYDGAAWQTVNYFGFTSATTNNNTFVLSIPYAADTGAVNAMVGTFSPAITSLQSGNIVTVKAANVNTGDTTLQCNALAPIHLLENGQVLQPRAITVGEILFLFFDGTNFQKLNPRWPYDGFDESAPPAADLFMAIGDQRNITFSNVTQVPLKTITVEGGVYEMEFVGTISNSQNTDICLWPNVINTAQTGFDWTAIVCSDGDLPNDNPITNPPYIYIIPAVEAAAPPTGPQSTACFFFDLFGGPSQNPADTINDIGPFMIRITCSTSAVAKMCRSWGAVRGGPSLGFTRWYDTTTPWTSLGTLTVRLPEAIYGTIPPVAAATISGMVIIKRLA